MKCRNLIALLLVLAGSAYGQGRAYIHTNNVTLPIGPTLHEPMFLNQGDQLRHRVLVRTQTGQQDLSEQYVRYEISSPLPTNSGDVIGYTNYTLSASVLTNDNSVQIVTTPSLAIGRYETRFRRYQDGTTNMLGLISHDYLYVTSAPAATSGGSGSVTLIQTNNVMIDQSVHNSTTTVYRGGWVNSSTAEYVFIRNGGGMSVSNVVSADGRTNEVYVSFGQVTPLTPTNLTGWSRWVYNQVAAGVAGATSEYFTVTESNGMEFVAKGWGGAGGSVSASAYGGGAAGGDYHFYCASGDVIRIDVAQGGARSSTSGVVRAWPDGGLSTNTYVTNSCGGASTRIWVNGILRAVFAGGGGGGNGVKYPGSGGYLTGGSGTGADAGTGATQSAGGLTGGGYLQGGDGPGSGGGGGVQGGGAGQANGAAGAGGASWFDAAYGYGNITPASGIAGAATGYNAAGNNTDVDYASGIGAGVVNSAGGSGRLVLYGRPRT